MAKQYYGKAALTIVRQKSNGSRVYVYAGQPVGDDVDAKEIERLEAEGFIEGVTVAAPVVVSTTDASGSDSDGAQSNPTAAPGPNAKKADWVEYAVSKGYDRAEAEKATQADLIKALG
ncbi:hypothetical protein L1080_004395 [Rhodococcus sp. MSC1_016]|jgi:hypothetical protein|uniref:hypothetical protein n=1 Tax=Rhodococcus sp. MSC1_016 TaxID=2909266 RepID=UPI00202F9530|nr:hypothetical protein [Rhodococcus sp. MSC1_016]